VPLGSVIQSLVSNLWFDNVVCSFSYVINKINPLYGCNKNITVFSKTKTKKKVYLVESGNKMHVWSYKLLMFLGNCLKKINWFVIVTMSLQDCFYVQHRVSVLDILVMNPGQ
jgi:hypothetical protein